MSDKSGRKPEGAEKPGPHQAAHPGGLPDAVELSREMAEIAEKSQRLVADFLQRQGGEAGHRHVEPDGDRRRLSSR